jgi:hypothetical protein
MAVQAFGYGCRSINFHLLTVLIIPERKTQVLSQYSPCGAHKLKRLLTPINAEPAALFLSDKEAVQNRTRRLLQVLIPSQPPGLGEIDVELDSRHMSS